MRNSWIVIIFFLFACGRSSTGPTTHLMVKDQLSKKFFSQDGQFRIMFEQEPAAYSQDIPYEGTGKIRMNYFIYEKGINLIYCISYADYPESFMNDKVAEDLLQHLLINYIDSQKAGLESQKMITINSWPGISFKASNSDTFVYGQYILKKNRLFQLTVTKEGGYPNESEVNSFFQSLELM
jgi:hypothetical protein